MTFFSRLKNKLGMILLSSFMLSASAVSAADLTVYTALEDDELVVYKEKFKKAHPNINLKLVRDSTGIITAKLLAEKDNPVADVIWGTAATSLLIADNLGLLKGYNPKGIKSIKPGFKDETNKKAHWVGIKAWMTGFVSNTYELKAKGVKAPGSYQDLLKPEYRGHLVMPNPSSSGTGYMMVSAILQLKGEKNGWKYLDKLHQNIAIYTHSGSKPAKMAGKGEYPIGISIANRGFKQKAKGEPVVTNFPTEGSGWDLEANGLIKKPRIKKAAKVFLDWAISAEMMKEYAKIYPVVASNLKVKFYKGWPENPAKQLAKNDFSWAAENRARILKEWTRRYDGKSLPKK